MFTQLEFNTSGFNKCNFNSFISFIFSFFRCKNAFIS